LVLACLINSCLSRSAERPDGEVCRSLDLIQRLFPAGFAEIISNQELAKHASAQIGIIVSNLRVSFRKEGIPLGIYSLGAWGQDQPVTLGYWLSEILDEGSSVEAPVFPNLKIIDDPLTAEVARLTNLAVAGRKNRLRPVVYRRERRLLNLLTESRNGLSAAEIASYFWGRRGGERLEEVSINLLPPLRKILASAGSALKIVTIKKNGLEETKYILELGES